MKKHSRAGSHGKILGRRKLREDGWWCHLTTPFQSGHSILPIVFTLLAGKDLIIFQRPRGTLASSTPCVIYMSISSTWWWTVSVSGLLPHSQTSRCCVCLHGCLCFRLLIDSLAYCGQLTGTGEGILCALVSENCLWGKFVRSLYDNLCACCLSIQVQRLQHIA